MTPTRQPHPQRCNIAPTVKNHCGNCQNEECDWYSQREDISRTNQSGVDHFSMRLATEMTGCRCHTSAQAPEPATAPCPQHRIWQHRPVAAQVAKAERERDQKQWQKLEDYIDSHSPWVPGTDDRVTDARKLVAEVRSLRSQLGVES